MFCAPELSAAHVLKKRVGYLVAEWRARWLTLSLSERNVLAQSRVLVPHVFRSP